MTHYTPACAYCGAEYEATRSDSRFCSANCRVKAHQNRKLQEAERLFDQSRTLVSAIASEVDPARIASLAVDARRLLRKIERKRGA